MNNITKSLHIGYKAKTNLQRNSLNNTPKTASPITNDTKNLAKVSSNNLKALYCSNIALRGNPEQDKPLNISEETIDYIRTISYYNNNAFCRFLDKLETGEVTQGDLFDFLKSHSRRGTVAHELAQSPKEYNKATAHFSPKQKLELLNLVNELTGDTVAHKLASRSSENEYNEATAGFSSEEKFKLLNLANKIGNTVAYELAYSPEEYNKATAGFSPKEKFKLLNLANKNGNTVAHRLAYSSEEYNKATAGFSPGRKFKLLNLADKNGNTVAHELAFYSPKEYNEATAGFSPGRKFKLLNLVNEGNGNTVAHRLAHSPEEYNKATADFSSEQKFKLLNLVNKNGNTVAYILAFYSPKG